MRKGIAGLSAMAQDVLRQKPAKGAVFAFRGRRGDRLKFHYWDGQGFCLYYKALERGASRGPALPRHARIHQTLLQPAPTAFETRRPKPMAFEARAMQT